MVGPSFFLILLLTSLAPVQSPPANPSSYAIRVEAAIQSNDPKAVLSSIEAVLHDGRPYDTQTDEASSDALRYLHLRFMPEALALHAIREPLILQALHSPHPSVSIPALYGDGVAFAMLQQFAGNTHAAAQTISELETALPSPLLPEDSAAIDLIRRQYDFLGTRLPRLALTRSLFAVGETPRINTSYGASTVLFLFPDTCGSCVRLAQRFRPTLARISQNDVHLYGLLAQPAQTAPTSPTADSSTPKTAAELLRGSPTLIVPPETLNRFAATHFPLLIATDSKGIIRFLEPIPQDSLEDALEPNGFLDQVTAHIAEHWPAEQPAPRP